MKKHHYFIADIPEKQQEFIIFNPQLVHHVVNVLKMSVGEKMMLTNGKGWVVEVIITFVTKERIEVKLSMDSVPINEVSIDVHLYCSITKREVFEGIVQKATELGVRTIIPLISERTIKTQLNLPRLKKIIQEAVQQSERAYIPELSDPMEITKSFFEKKDMLRYIFDRSGRPMNTFFSQDPAVSSSVALYIGPEGGWSDHELNFFKIQNNPLVSFGPTVLKTDTAVVTSLLFVRMMRGI